MGAVWSLSKSTTITCWYLSLLFTFLFGAVFLAAWLTEEFAESDKWKNRKKLLITLAVIGVFGEQICTLAEFTFSEHLQTLAELEVTKIEKSMAWRQLTPEQTADIISSLKKFAGQKINVFAYNGDLEGWTFADQIAVALGNAGWDVHFARIMWARLTISGILVETTP